MKDIACAMRQVINSSTGKPKRFHDGYFSLLAQIEAGITGKFLG